MKDRIDSILRDNNIILDKDKIVILDLFMSMMLEVNKKVNLTGIKDEMDFIKKHFLDSLLITCHFDINENSKIIDLGTGGGFPGIPLKIMYPEIDIVMVDSVKKKIDFVNEAIKELNLKGSIALHTRIEDLAHDSKYRERFDICLSRALAPMNVLSEYCLPFVKKQGVFIAYKSDNIDDEIKEAKRAISLLGGSLIDIIKVETDDFKRSFVIIEKESKTSNKYPRKPGEPKKKPL